MNTRLDTTSHVVVRKRSIRLLTFTGTIRIDDERFHARDKVNPHKRRWSRELCMFLITEGHAEASYW